MSRITEGRKFFDGRIISGQMDKFQDFVDRFRDNHESAADYPVDVLNQFLTSLFLSPDLSDKKLIKEICNQGLDAYSDLWYYSTGLLRNIAIVCQMNPQSIPARDTHLLKIVRVMESQSVSSSDAMTRVFTILDQMKKPTQQLTELPVLVPVFGSKKLSFYRLAFKNCWIEVLRGSSELLGRDTLIKLLRVLPDTVMPHITDANIFSSFFCHCFEQKDDIEVSLLSISGLFLLISRYNLGEPTELYSRLYQLISPEALSSQRSATRVFQMIIKALRSPLMPSQYVTVFAKRLIRTAVIVHNPSLSLWLVVAAFNLMQANPTVAKQLVHVESETSEESFTNKDSFSMECEDIDEAAKLMNGTCLWELELLTSHSDPSVVRMANLFKTNFFSRKAKRLSSDDYLLITADQLMQRELRFGKHTQKGSKGNRGSIELENLVGLDMSAGNELLIPLRPHIEHAKSLTLKRTYDRM